MNVLETIIAVFILIIIILTFIAEPVTSFEYGKAVLKTGVKTVKWTIEQTKHLNSNNITNTTKVNDYGNQSN